MIRFLSGIWTKFVTGLDDPLLETDAVNKRTLDAHINNTDIHGSSTQPLDGYTLLNFDVDKTLDASSSDINKVSDVLSTLIDDLQNGYAGSSRETFETVSKNLKQYDYAFTYTDGVLTSIVYDLPSGTITKTFNYTDGKVTSIVLSGNVPTISLTKTLAYTGNSLTSISYS